MHDPIWGYDFSIMSNQPSKEHSVGYCHCKTHKGKISVKMLKKHQCLGKQCPFLQKYEDHPYWEQRRRKKELKKLSICS